MKRKCGNCLLYSSQNGNCKVAILVNGQKHHLPVFPEDNCHWIDLGIPIDQVRWWVENPETKEPTSDGVVKIEYPEGLLPYGDGYNLPKKG